MTSTSDLKADELTQKLLAGNRRALARVLSLIEDDAAGSERVIASIFPNTGKAHVIGFTGSPGAGKSTLVDRVAVALTDSGKKVAVVAVDPSSPFTGGAILGDRIRMSNAGDKEIYIRSMASRGALGGLAPRSAEFIFALDAAGFDYILLETVGVGQGEVEIVRHCDTVCVVLVPGMGDGIQALKAGILEIADLYIINKADYDGADRLERELLMMLSLGDSANVTPERPTPPIVRTVASEGKGTSDLISAVTKQFQSALDSGSGKARREMFLADALQKEVTRTLVAKFSDFAATNSDLPDAVKKLSTRSSDPRTLARELVKNFTASSR